GGGCSLPEAVERAELIWEKFVNLLVGFLWCYVAREYGSVAANCLQMRSADMQCSVGLL
ncbi:hypothetical protein NPIL_190571, partial [Nephila pilipes]